MSNNIKSQELQIGKKAAKMAQNYVLAIIRQKIHVRGIGGEKMKPILKATKVKAKMGDYRLLGLNFTSNKVGFILHFGYVGVRNATTVYYDAARYQKSSSSRKRTTVTMPAKDIFPNIYVKSGALDYLVSELSETRTEAFKIKLENIVIKINKEDERS